MAELYQKTRNFAGEISSSIKNFLTKENVTKIAIKRITLVCNKQSILSYLYEIKCTFQNYLHKIYYYIVNIQTCNEPVEKCLYYDFLDILSAIVLLND